MSKEVIEIVREYLLKNGYTGLCNEAGCGCQLDDLVPCGEIMGDCMAGMALHRTCGCDKCPAKEHCEVCGECAEGETCTVTELRDPTPE